MDEQTPQPNPQPTQQPPAQPSQPQLSRRERRRLEREKRRQEIRQTVQKEQGKKRGGFVIYGVVLLLIIAGGYGIYAFTTQPTSNSGIDLSGIPSGYIHWHADVDVVVCGEDKQLPEAVGSAHIGTDVLHTHSRQENLGSMPASDGNGVMHIEGTPLTDPFSYTLGKFMSGIFIPFSETQIMDKKNGDLCPDGKAGNVTVTKNGNPLPNPLNYIPRDGDFIVISFG